MEVPFYLFIESYYFSLHLMMIVMHFLWCFSVAGFFLGMSGSIELGGNSGNEIAEASSTSHRKRKLTSVVWNDFDKYTRDDGRVYAMCRHCKKSLVGGSKSGTTHLRNHLKYCLPYERVSKNQLDVGQLLLQLGDAKKEEGETIGTLSYKFDQELSQHELARMIILHEYPFSIVEHAGFRSFVCSLQPLFRIPSRNTVKSDCMKIFESERHKLSDLLEKLSSRMSLTIDMWSSGSPKKNLGYVCLTAHYIDEEWKLQKRIINFCAIKIPYTGEGIAKRVMEKLFNWNIDMKLSSIVLDNCSTNDVVTQELVSKLAQRGLLPVDGAMFHVCCFAHSLNLIVQDGLLAIHEAVHKIRESIKYIKSAQFRQQQFNEVARQVRAPQKSIPLDDPTRWNTTYLMLEVALEFKYAFSDYAEHDSSYKHAPTYEEWENVTIVCNCLRVFYQIIQTFCSMKYPTSSMYFAEVCSIHLFLNEWGKSPNPFLVSIASKMMDKFQKFWDVTGMVLAIAAILDPRLKMKSVEYYFPLIYTSEGEIKISEVRNGLKNLYNDYMVRSTQTSLDREYPGNIGSSSGSVSSECGGIRKVCVSSSHSVMFDTRRGFDKFLQETSSTDQKKTDLEIYLDEAVYPVKKGLDESFDILAWWNLSAPKYPIVAMMARDILGIPVSMVSFEELFCTEGRTLDRYRSCMRPTTTESLVCAQDWLRNELKGILIF